MKHMQHRHLNHQHYTLTAIDDVIVRGRWVDWADLRRAVRTDMPLLDRIERACRAHVPDPYAQRYHFWIPYVQARRRHDAT